MALSPAISRPNSVLRRIGRSSPRMSQLAPSRSQFSPSRHNSAGDSGGVLCRRRAQSSLKWGCGEVVAPACEHALFSLPPRPLPQKPRGRSTTCRLRGPNKKSGAASTPLSTGTPSAALNPQTSSTQSPLVSPPSSLVHPQLGSHQPQQGPPPSGAGYGQSVGLSAGDTPPPALSVGTPTVTGISALRSNVAAVGATPPGAISAPTAGGATGGGGVQSSPPAQKAKKSKKGKGASSSTAVSATAAAVSAPAKVAVPSVAPPKESVLSTLPELPRFEDEEEMEGFGGEEADELEVFRGLVLDCSYRPINVVCWKRALCLEIAEKVDVLEYYDVAVKSTSRSFPIPAVLRVSNFVHTPKQTKRRLSLSRNNIFLRDKFKCQYCGSKDNLTIDHVKALSRGGGSSWENLVTACSPCNLKKGDKSPTEAGMRLAQPPKEPRELDCSKLPPNYRTFRSLARHKSTPPQWLDWLPMQQPSII